MQYNCRGANLREGASVRLPGRLSRPRAISRAAAYYGRARHARDALWIHRYRNPLHANLREQHGKTLRFEAPLSCPCTVSSGPVCRPSRPSISACMGSGCLLRKHHSEGGTCDRRRRELWRYELAQSRVHIAGPWLERLAAPAALWGRPSARVDQYTCPATARARALSDANGCARYCQSCPVALIEFALSEVRTCWSGGEILGFGEVLLGPTHASDASRRPA